MSQLQKIVLANGCFWCTEAVFQRVEGVTEAVSGYTGGQTPNPSYREVCSGTTGHAEAVSVTFDGEITTLSEILDIFWQTHDPTTLNRQGADVGTQYRSAIFYSDEAQLAIIQESIAKLEQSGDYSDPIVTQIEKLTEFFPAEEYHHNYYNLNSSEGYCRVVISPKLKKLADIQAGTIKL